MWKQATYQSDWRSKDTNARNSRRSSSTFDKKYKFQPWIDWFFNLNSFLFWSFSYKGVREQTTSVQRLIEESAAYSENAHQSYGETLQQTPSSIRSSHISSPTIRAQETPVLNIYFLTLKLLYSIVLVCR